MELNAYQTEHEVQATHWWFVGRRYLFSKIIKNLKLSSSAPILDVGSSTGTNLSMLSTLGFNNFCGIDISPEAIKFCQERGFNNVKLGDACHIATADNAFDLVLATDILEHVDDDEVALREIYRVLKPNAHLLLTVPAFQSLWGPNDDMAHHKRRYRLHRLLKKIEKSDFSYQKAFYFNYILFIPIFILRKIFKIFNIEIKSENNINSKWLNFLLTKIFMADLLTAAKIPPPFGVSIFILSKKNNS